MINLALTFTALVITTIVLIGFNQKIQDTELQTVGWLGIMVCLLLGLILLPWPIKLFLVLVLLIAPTCHWKCIYFWGTCLPLCLARSICR